MTKLFLVIMLSISIIGCSTMRAVENPRYAAQHDLKRGDEIAVTTLAGQMYELKVRSLSNDALVGRDGNGKLWKVPIDQISHLEVKELSVGRTAALSGGVALLILSVLAVAGAYAFAKGWEDAFSGGD